jgi:dTMP kinase
VSDAHKEGAGAVLVAEPEPGVYRRLLSNASFRRLWLSLAVSGIGDWIIIGFLMPLVTQLSGGSTFAVAGILIAKIIPSLFLGSLIGVFVDLFDRRRLMITMDLIRAVLVLGLVFTDSLAVIYAVVLVMEVASLFFYPSKNALIPMLVDEEDVASANGLAYTTQQAAMLVGLSASGAILAVFERAIRLLIESDLPIVSWALDAIAPELLGPRAGVFLDSATFLLSAFFLTLMAVEHVGRRKVTVDRSLIGKDIRQSFSFLKEHRELRGFLVTIGLAILGGGAIVPVGLIHVQQNLTTGVPFLEQVPVLDRLIAAPQTFIMVFLAAGMFAGALVIPRLAKRSSLQLLFLGAVAGFGVSMAGFASVEWYSIAGVFAAAAGFCIAAVTVAGNTYVAETVDDSIRGRVFTSMESVIRVALLLSMVVIAPLGDLIGGIVKRVVEARGILPADVVLTGSRLTLQLASLIVLMAAVYAYRTLDWRSGGAADD